MPKLPVLKPRQVIQALERAGFVQTRQRGSHVRLQKGERLVTVPMHARDLNPTVLRSILRQAGMTQQELQEYL